MEIQKGASLDDIQKKITKGKIQTGVAKQLKSKKHFGTEKIQRKKWDLMQILNKYEAKPVHAEQPITPKALTAVELFAKEKEEQDSSPVLNRSIYKINDKELLVRNYMFDTFICKKI